MVDPGLRCRPGEGIKSMPSSHREATPQLTRMADRMPSAPGLELRVLREGDRLTWSVARTAAPSIGVDQAEWDHAVVAALGSEPARPIDRLVIEPGPGFRVGAPLTVGRSRPLPTDGSSNAVSLVSIDGVDYVHKRYVQSRPECATEVAALRTVHGSAVAPSLLAGYHHVDDDGTRWPLGLLYRYVPGTGLDVPLRADLRSFLAAPPAIRPDLGPSVEQLLHATGALVRTVHGLLATGGTTEVPGRKLGMPSGPVTPIVELDTRAVLDATRADIDAVLPGVLDLPHPAANVAAAALYAEVAALRRAGPTRAAASPGHGDLHLGQIVVDAAGDPASLRLIDLSPTCLDPTEPAYRRQSPLQDLVSLQRAFEYFSVEEAHRGVAAASGAAEETVAAAANTGTGLPAGTAALLRTAERRAAHWRQVALAAAIRGYGERWSITQQPLYRLLYLRRLVHELRYDIENGRPRYAVFNLRCAGTLPAASAGLRNPVHRGVR